ncbi:MAG: caspase family protein [Halioglobus sp.]
MTYMTPRRPVRTAAVECEIRGGEYVSYDRANFATALSVWLETAKEGDAKAQHYVGHIFEKGLGVEPNFAESAKWYGLSANAGNIRAMISLAQLYEKGLGVDQNLELASQWYGKALGTTPALDPGSLRLESAKHGANSSATDAGKNAEIENLEEQLTAANQSMDESLRETARIKSEYQQQLRELDLERQRLSESDSSQSALIAQLQSQVDLTQSQLDLKQRQLSRLEQETERTEQEKLYYQNLQTASTNQEASQIDAMQALLTASGKQLKQAQKDLELVRNQSSSQQANLESSQQTIAALQGQLSSQKNDIDLLEKQLAAPREELAKQVDHIRELEQRVAEADSLTRQQEKQLAQAQGEKATELSELISNNKKALEKIRPQLELARQRGSQKEAELRSREQTINEMHEASLRGRDELEKLSDNLRSIQAHAQSERNEDMQRIAELEEEVQRLNLDAGRYREQIEAQAEAPEAPTATVAMIGPKITIVEPQVPLTRGLTVIQLKNTASEEKRIIGRVEAPAGLYELLVNEQTTPVKQNGMFDTRIKLRTGNQLVTIAAIDNQGQRQQVQLEFSSSPQTQKKKSNQGFSGIAFGNYYALLIGNSNYRHMPDLNTPTADVQRLNELLSSRYGFITTMLLDATREQTITAVNELRKKLTSEDNLIIYYAGHGGLDEINNRGHWLPVDAEADNPAQWITNTTMTDMTNIIAAKHVLMVADSCYSGALTRSSLADLRTGMTDSEYENYLRTQSKKRARTALTSGGLKPVLDSGGGTHSMFARALIDVLESNETVMEGRRLHQEVLARVSYRAASISFEQEPEYAPLNFSGHEGGDFLFVPKI